MENINIDSFHPLTIHVGLANQQRMRDCTNINSPFTRIYYVLNGEATITLNNQVLNLRRGHLYMLPAFTPHSYSCNGSFEFYYIHIYDDVNHRSFMDKWNFPLEIEATLTDLQLIKRLRETNPSMELKMLNPSSYDNQPTLNYCIRKNKERNVGLRLESRGILLLLLSRFFAEATPKDCQQNQQIMPILNWIETNLEQSINIEQLAMRFCIGKDALIRLFNKEIGQTPLQYIIAKKIEKAQLLLSMSNLSIKEISWKIGYEDYSYFTRIFKKHVGESPLEYKLKYNDFIFRMPASTTVSSAAV